MSCAGKVPVGEDWEAGSEIDFGETFEDPVVFVNPVTSNDNFGMSAKVEE